MYVCRLMFEPTLDRRLVWGMEKEKKKRADADDKNDNTHLTKPPPAVSTTQGPGSLHWRRSSTPPTDLGNYMQTILCS
jgi:hypothetical protein